MKICFISDTHSHHREINVPKDIDLLVHCGDFSTYIGEVNVLRDFNKWLGEIPLPIDRKIVIAGNHDTMFENNYNLSKLEIFNATYLQDEFVKVDGVKIYGSPWTPNFCSWAFMYERNSVQAYNKWRSIPEDIDVLVTHGPPYGILDAVPDRHPSVGCEVLAERISQLKSLKVHAFGHIHNSFENSTQEHNGVIFVNASTFDEDHMPVQDKKVIVTI